MRLFVPALVNVELLLLEASLLDSLPPWPLLGLPGPGPAWWVASELLTERAAQGWDASAELWLKERGAQPASGEW